MDERNVMIDRMLHTLQARPEQQASHASQPYMREIAATLPRVLASMDCDPLSPTFGIADRQYWAWKLIDFPNATFQGAANGLVHLAAAGLLHNTLAPAAVGDRLADLMRGTRAVTRRDGSLEEALPYERSFCVTALVAFDLLRCHDDLSVPSLTVATHDLHRTVAPLISFLKRADETHGTISNHLATAVAALLRWHRLDGDLAAKRKADELLKRILAMQSPEGWLPEYGGADPGYQSLCLTYLADAALVAPSARLTEALTRSVRFLWHFAHPDGSFGGIYGSRCTRLYYPAGLEALSGTIPEAAALALFMRGSIARQTTVPLSAIDAPNLVPLFNNYCWAARLAQATSSQSGATGLEETEPGLTVPAMRQDHFRQHFPAAGLLVDHSANHHTVISTHKGGVVCHTISGSPSVLNTGVAVRDDSGRQWSSQTYDPGNRVSITADGDAVTVTAPLRRLKKPMPAPWSFLVLRILSVTVMRMPAASDLIKQILARLLITAKGRQIGINHRTIRLGPTLSISDRVVSTVPLTRIDDGRPFSVIHMASQGYWQVQDGSPQTAGNTISSTDQGGL